LSMNQAIARATSLATSRGGRNGRETFDWDADSRPEMEFYLVLRAKG